MKHIFQTSIAALSLTFLVVFAESCGHTDANEAKEVKASGKEAAPELQVFTVGKGKLEATIQIPGELQAFQQVDLYAKVNSFVKKLYVDVGSEVKAGQLLATMEAPEINAQLSGADSKLKAQEAIYLSSKATYDRLLETSKTPGTVSQNDLDIASAKQKSDKAQLDAARAAYNEVGNTRDYLEIRASFNGVIAARNVSAGAYVGPSGKGSDLPMFTLSEQKKLRLVVSVPEQYTSYIDNHTPTSFTVQSLPNQTFNASVSRLAGALDNRLRSQRTEMDVDNKDGKLLPGMVAEVSFILKNQMNAFVVPTSAVLKSTQGVFVIKVQDSKTVWVPVKTGRSDDSQTEVFGDIADNDILVTNATEEVRDGAPSGLKK